MDLNWHSKSRTDEVGEKKCGVQIRDLRKSEVWLSEVRSRLSPFNSLVAQTNLVEPNFIVQIG